MNCKLLFTCAAILLLIMACSKTDNNAILFRVQNTTDQNLTNVQAEGYNFGNLTAGATTKYTKVEKLNSYPGTHFYIDAQSFNASIYMDLVANFLPPGKYTLKIYKDTLPGYPYNSIFDKE